MEEKNIEQPSFDAGFISNEEISDFEKIDTENQNGSMYGKFKDAKNLLDAYNSLQGEFTRKSQKLADLQKKYEEIAVFAQSKEEIDDVLEKCTDSDKYKKEIEEIISKNNSINSLPNKYSVALETIKEAENKIAEKLNSQEFYDEYISKNEKIKAQIIDEYLSKLNNISTTPKIIAGNSTSVHFSPAEKPKTMKEAGEIFSKMLK